MTGAEGLDVRARRLAPPLLAAYWLGPRSGDSGHCAPRAAPRVGDAFPCEVGAVSIETLRRGVVFFDTEC